MLLIATLGVDPFFAGSFVREEIRIPDSLSLHINAMSYHLSADRSELNEENLGLGLSCRLGRFDSSVLILNKVKVFAEFDLYSDSFSEFGYTLGTAFQKKLFKQLDYGFSVGLMHENNLEEKSGLYLHPYIIPYLQTRFDGFLNARVHVVPPVQNKGFVTLQLIVDF